MRKHYGVREGLDRGAAQVSNGRVAAKRLLYGIEHDPDFIPRTGGAQTTDEAYNELVTAVTEMMNASPERARAQYQQTFAALARMRDAYQEHDSPTTG
jgi:hypothetical protein